ncbi:hypothetical protein H0H93_003525 [Arthromyces matolae]|nr:hypothetical protein H0H93_003525 [Arthromyces matolae]
MTRTTMNFNSDANSSTLPRLLTPGVFDRGQNDRIRRYPDSKLSFASFDPHTATSEIVLPDIEQLSLKAELNRSQRVVVETLPSGVSTWRFVPRAQRAEGIPDEGTWPRMVEISGTFWLCSQEQWDIFKLDPVYHCYIRTPPACPIIQRRVETMPEVPQTTPVMNPRPTSPIPTRTNHSSNGVRFDIESSDSEDEQDEVEDMIVDDGRSAHKSTGGGPKEKHRTKVEDARKTRREKIARRSQRLAQENNEAGPSSSQTPAGRSKSAPAQPAAGKRKVNTLFDTLNTNGTPSFDSTRPLNNTPPKSTANYRPSEKRKKKVRTVSPDEVKRTLAAKKAAIRQQRQEQRKRELEMRRFARDEQLRQAAFTAASDVEMPDVPLSQGTVEMDSPGPEPEQELHGDEDPEFYAEKTPVPDDFERGEEFLRAARIEESRRKMAELERDRPLWDAAAARRKEEERLEQESIQRRAAQNRARAAAQEREEKAKKAAEEQRRREEAAHAERQKEINRLIEHEQERRRNLQLMHNYWNSQTWDADVALHRYRTLIREFGKAKFVPGIIPLRVNDIPWPILSRDYRLEAVTLEEVSRFFDTVRPILGMESYKDLLKKSSLRFHPDHWGTRIQCVEDEGEKELISEATGTIIQHLTFLLSQC